jgi:GNAT superfamily N-acetyltransferase
MISTDTPIIRTWRSADSQPLDDLLVIMSQSHGRAVSHDWLAQKLSWGLGGVAALAYDQGEPVGVVLFGASPYEIEGVSTRVALSFDTYVSPIQRGRGLFSRLLNAAEAECRAAGFSLLLNFPNDASRPGFEKNGWTALNPTHPFVHVPSGGGLAKMSARLRRLRRDRNSPFVPDASHYLDDDATFFLLPRTESSPGLAYSLSESSLRYRFHARRGDGYVGLSTGNVQAVVRVGSRGQLREAQVLVTYPRRLAPVESRDLLKEISSVHSPDLITHLESSTERGVLAVARGGFFPLNTRTTPYFKELVPGCMPSACTLSGIDIHTW